MNDASVLVVGGRTTGLMMSAELARRGVPVRIVDKSPGIDPHCRANLLHSRTLEIFLGLGIVDDVINDSFQERRINIYAGGELVGVNRHEPIDSPFPFGMSQSQAKTEAVLEAHLNRYGVRVERRVELVSLIEHEDRVVATLLHPGGREETVETAWLIGCDGAHSTTRHLTGCAFPGDKDPFAYVLADVAIQGELEDEVGYTFMHEEGDLFIFTMLAGRRRLVCASLAAGSQPVESPTLEQIQTLIDTRGLPGLKISDPRWLANFHIHYRLAAHYRHGRTILAGDAAHVHSLLAGQGMNTGIQDAFNLVWKLALVIRGVAPESWLDTYELERRTVGESVVAMTKTITESAEHYAGLSPRERERLVAHMLIPEPERLQAARHLQEVDLDYRASPLCREVEGEFELGPHAGMLAPNASPIVFNGERKNLVSLLAGINHRLLLMGGDLPSQATKRLVDVCRVTQQTHGHWLDVSVVTPDDRQAIELPAGVTRIGDPDAALRERFAANKPCLYLIRPDGHIAYRSRRIDSLGEYLGQVL